MKPRIAIIGKGSVGSALEKGLAKNDYVVCMTAKDAAAVAVGFATSAAGEIARKAPRARVIKAFNTVFAQNMSTGKVKGEQLTLLVAGDDDAAKKTVLVHGKRHRV
jgi:predicted dinucleotide-binding enzyme